MNRSEYMKNFRKSDIGIKSNRISNWKKQGLKDDYDKVYERYINTKHCDDCKILLTTDGQSKTTRCMDHCHKTGKFRNILCKKCNSMKRENQKNKHGHRGIYFDKKKKIYSYQKRYNNKIIYIKKSQDKITILTYKFCYLLLFNRDFK